MRSLSKRSEKSLRGQRGQVSMEMIILLIVIVFTLVFFFGDKIKEWMGLVDDQPVVVTR